MNRTLEKSRYFYGDYLILITTYFKNLAGVSLIIL